MVYQILRYLPARDLKTIRLVNKLLSRIGRNNLLWSSLARQKWSEKLCLTTLPLPSPSLPDPSSDDEMTTCGPNTSDDVNNNTNNVDHTPDTETYLREMQDFADHTYDELKPYSLWELAHWFPAFVMVEGSWLRAYNLVEQHLEVGYLHSVVRRDSFSVSDTQWELYPPESPFSPKTVSPESRFPKTRFPLPFPRHLFS